MEKQQENFFLDFFIKKHKKPALHFLTADW